MKKLLFSLLLLCLVMFMVAPASAKTNLVVYTSIEPELLPLYKKDFEQAQPDISITWVRDSTGIITAKLLAEKANPRADIVFGLAASSLLILQKEGMLVPHLPKDMEKINPKMRDNFESPEWVGTVAWASAFCVNKIEMEKRGLTPPTSWKDLTKPEFKDQIAMPDPASSGTGFMNLTAWIQLWGEEEAWKYADALYANTKIMTHSGTKPCVMAAQGEVLIGVSSAAFIKPLLARKAPIIVNLPDEGLGWEAEAVAIIKGTQKIEAAKKMMDWATSDDVAKLGADFSGLTARPDFVTEQAKPSEAKLIANDLRWAAENRTRLLQSWKERFSK